MKFQVLISTMNLKSNKENIELIKKMNITTNSLTINQITEEKIQEFNQTKGSNRVISKKEKGLSKSRNLAIEESNADICLFADDDLIYEQDYEKIILEGYKKNPKADVLCFLVESNNKSRKIKRMCTSNIGKLRAMRICSFQISFKRNKLIENNIYFDENFGAGTYYNRGEELIFLWECIDKGLKVNFISKKIASVKQEDSSWFNGYDEAFFKKQGAVFYRLSSKFYKLLIFQYATRKYNLYKDKMRIKGAIQVMLAGAKEYKVNRNF